MERIFARYLRNIVVMYAIHQFRDINFKRRLMNCYETCLSKKGDLVWLARLTYCRDDLLFATHSHYCTKLLSSTVRPLPVRSKTILHVLLTVWWSQSCKVRIYLRASFSYGLVSYFALSDRLPMLYFMHQHELVAWCRFLSYCFFRRTERSLRTCTEHPKQRRLLTAAGVLLTSSLICRQLPLHVSLTKYLPPS